MSMYIHSCHIRLQSFSNKKQMVPQLFIAAISFYNFESPGHDFFVPARCKLLYPSIPCRVKIRILVSNYLLYVPGHSPAGRLPGKANHGQTDGHWEQVTIIGWLIWRRGQGKWLIDLTADTDWRIYPFVVLWLISHWSLSLQQDICNI